MPTLHHVLDASGTNPNNLVSGELATGIGSPNRIIKPEYGPFHVGSQVVVDSSTNTPLIYGEDYDCVGLVQEASIKFQKPIAEFIKLKKPGISSTVRLQYQCLGGLYQNDSSVLANLWNSFINDNRPVSFNTGVIDKPFEYPPGLHPTLFKDVSGYEPLIAALERMTQAITVSNVPAFQNIIDWVLTIVPKTVTAQEIDEGIPVQKTVTFDTLLYSLSRLNFNAITIEADRYIVDNGATVRFNITANNLEPSVNLYWTLEHTTTTVDDFASTSGNVNLINGKGSFQVQLMPSTTIEPGESFKIKLHKNSIDGHVLGKSHFIVIRGNDPEDLTDIFNSCCLYSPTNQINPVSMYVHAGQTFNFHQH